MSNVKSQPTKLKPSKNQKGRRRREKKRGGEGRITKGKGIDTKKLLECKNNTWAYYGTLRYPGSGGVDRITQHHPRGNWHLEQDWGEEEPIFMSSSPSRGEPCHPEHSRVPYRQRFAIFCAHTHDHFHIPLRGLVVLVKVTL